MISPHQKLSVFENQALDLPEIVGRNATVLSQGYRLQPELALALRRSNVDVGGLARFIGVEVKAIRPYP
jgi:hypothetical protein